MLAAGGELRPPGASNRRAPMAENPLVQRRAGARRADRARRGDRLAAPWQPPACHPRRSGRAGRDRAVRADPDGSTQSRPGATFAAGRWRPRQALPRTQPHSIQATGGSACAEDHRQAATRPGDRRQASTHAGDNHQATARSQASEPDWEAPAIKPQEERQPRPTASTRHRCNSEPDRPATRRRGWRRACSGRRTAPGSGAARRAIPSAGAARRADPSAGTTRRTGPAGSRGSATACCTRVRLRALTASHALPAVWKSSGRRPPRRRPG